MRFVHRILLTALPVVLALAGVALFLAFSNPVSASRAGSGLALASPVPTSDPITPTVQVYMPKLIGGGTPGAELVDHGFNDQLGIDKYAFLPGTPFTYFTLLHNHYPYSITVGLQISQTSLCGDRRVFSGTLTLPPGLSRHRDAGQALDCTGVYSSTANLIHRTEENTFTAHYVVTQPGIILISSRQGFDRCSPPDLEDMQTWWDESPYWVFNLYLGGESFFCRNTPLDAVYVYELAQQGWSFILTWVGPQAPCGDFLHEMSSDPETARQEGRNEADLAFARAEELGIFDNMVIYYDMEAYSSNAPLSCRNTVSAFMEGWAERLHERQVKAGGYGAGCTSYISDWAENNPPPDDVWLARWLLPAQYRPDVTAYDITCVDNSLWPEPTHRRLRQYAGGHAETWGGASMIIDSNVLDGEVTALPGANPDTPQSAPPVETQVYGPPMNALGRSGAGSGWVISDGRLLTSRDGGAIWLDVTPDATEFLAADFPDAANGWAIARQADREGLSLAQTRDGGLTWQFSLLPDSDLESLGAAGAAIQAVDATRVQIALQRPTSSAFVIHELLSTQDAGQTWQSSTFELSAGQTNPAELEFFAGGGLQAATTASLPGTIAQAFFDSQNGWAIVQRGQCRGEKGVPQATGLVCTQEWMLLATGDGGHTWWEITPYDGLPAR